MPASCSMAREGRTREDEAFCRLAVLGKAEPELRRPECRAGVDRTRAGSSRRQSDGTDVHRRPERRLAVSGIAQGGLRESTHIGFSRRRLTAHQLLHYRNVSMRPTAEQIAPGGNSELPTFFAARTGVAEKSESCRRLGQSRVRLCRPGFSGIGVGNIHTQADVSPRCRISSQRTSNFARFIPSQSTKHLHRQTDRADVRCNLPSSETPSETVNRMAETRRLTLSHPLPIFLRVHQDQ